MSASTVEASPATPEHGRRQRQGSLTGLAWLALAVVIVALLSLMIGNKLLAPGRVVSVLVDSDGSEAAAIIHGLRLPRTLLLIVVGAALGVAGALMQGHTRNPLADPGLLGVEAGASLAVVIGIFSFGISSALAYTWFAMAGAGLAAWLVFAIGSTRGGPNPTTLVLAGSAVSALAAALTSAIVTSDVSTLDDYRFWAVGSAAGRGLDVLWQVLPFIVVGLVLAAASAPGINLLQLGDDVAVSLGMSPARQKAMGISAIMLLSGAAVAACGPIVFVGLVVPHVARYVAGLDYRWLVPYAGLIGALILTAADIVGRVVAGGRELQVGIVMALIGGPAFVVLVRRRKAVAL
ncbi:FecCD family ABC transporter permease [Luteipulveratus mongoliensis]|uniref:Iron ABC transporter permease n=1 Tax=Luteipulveratus mongoliensis TaxID=571913 RepID=A0A0K1JNQ2_9MICO|nr:iron ABC transporter permease [Luteipulveratus mongoliensis]AKU18347.1 iron ABC transporter permease [Luteipulveratus mongoliensis]